MNSQILIGRSLSTPIAIISWVCRIVAALVLLQTLFFKFSAAPESVYIFTKVSALMHEYLPFLSVAMLEPAGRLGSGVMELIAAILLLTPRFVWAGALIAIAVMLGAILSHLTVLGIEVQGDKGLLFALALTVFVASSIAVIIHRRQLPVVGERF